jgi:type IV secretion system protein TrbF
MGRRDACDNRLRLSAAHIGLSALCGGIDLFNAVSGCYSARCRALSVVLEQEIATLMNVMNLVRSAPIATRFSPVYWASRRKQNERYSIHEQEARRWRLMAFCCAGVAMLAVGYLGYDASLSKYTPYVVERDHVFDERGLRAAERVSPTDPRIIQTQVKDWLFDVRTVSPDAENQRRLILDAYNHTDKSAPAAGELNEWYQKNYPFSRAADEVVTITVTSAIPADPSNWKLWRATWIEVTRTRAGEVKSSVWKEISMEITYKPPATEDDFNKNPSGIFATNFAWKN